MVYKYNGILFSREIEGILTLTTLWMDMGDVMLSEIRETQKDKYCTSTIPSTTYVEPKTLKVDVFRSRWRSR